ncbi:uncharacterized protein NPIL_526741 [Nephila pilipes]|uniref:Uncharacterized protein n=1 Tax=Nephila pilipes TaxID=299642 RepID=A0A8X6MPL2_NEPPI|nr:uncharacterized protein NPIL_526741 [Nephila pilipes]
MELKIVIGVLLCACNFLHKVLTYYTNGVRQHLNITFKHHWIGCDSLVHWPARKSDQSCLNFWGHKKSLMYDTPVELVEDLVARISLTVGEIRDAPGVFQNDRDSSK